MFAPAFVSGQLTNLLASASPAAGDLAFLSLAAAAELVRRRKVSPVELTQACLRRIEKLNPGLNAFISVTAGQALADAREREKERPRGPLHGIPVAIKDLIDLAGVRTTAASAQWLDRVADRDAEVVRRLKAAGAVIVGKTNMDEFAYNFTSETSHFGASRNPWDAKAKRTPGGSSGGSAIAPAAGMCYAALGSDTGGSIRLPAALCGITGLKPTYGEVSVDGAAPLAWSLDHIGPMCRDARDAALVLDAISRPRRVAADVKSVRIGVPRRVFFDELDAEVSAAVEEALAALRRITAGVRDAAIPELPAYPAFRFLPLAYSHIIVAEAFAFHEETLKRSPERYHPGTRKSIEGGRGVTAAEYIKARREMERLRAESGVLFRDADLLVTPTSPGPAFELGKPASLIYLRNCAPWNLYGLPSISIPCGFTRSGLPVGLQITGPARRDGLVLALAAAYQRVTDWHARRPPMAA